MRQRTLAEEGFERFRKRTRREEFLEEMRRIIPWAELCGVIEPFYASFTMAANADDFPVFLNIGYIRELHREYVLKRAAFQIITNNIPALHNKIHFVVRCYIFEGIAREGDNVGVLAWIDAAQIVRLTQHCRRV